MCAAPCCLSCYTHDMCMCMSCHAHAHVQRLPLASLPWLCLCALAARREPSEQSSIPSPEVHLPPKQPAEEAAALRAAKPRLGKIRWARKFFTHTRVRACVRACVRVCACRASSEMALYTYE